MNKKNIKKLVSIIKRSKKIVISGHINPDGDCIGSMLSLGLALKKLKKKVDMVSVDGIPARYRNIPGSKLVQKRVKGIYDLAISVDCPTSKLLGATYEVFMNATYVVAVDHHEFRENFSDLKIIDTKASAVGEIVFDIINALKVKITKDIAVDIMTSILVETNSFRLPNVTGRTFNLCAKLTKTGFDYKELSNTVYWSRSKQVSMLSGLCLSRCNFIRSGRIAWSVIRLKDFKKFKGKDDDVDVVADEIRAITGVEIALLFREKSLDKIRVSLRSKNVNIAKVAEKFSGGGHYDVAGCVIPNSKKAIDEVVKAAEKIL